MSDFDQAHRIDLRDYISNNFSGELKKFNSNYHFNGCPNCGHNDCFTIYNADAKFHCFSCGKNGDIIDLLILTGRAKDNKEAFEILGIESTFVSKARDIFQGTVKAISGDVVKGLNTVPAKVEGKSLLSHESLFKSKPLTERIREQIKNAKESNPFSLSESEQAVEPAKEKEVEEDPFKIEPVKNDVTLGTTQQLTEDNYFQSRGLSSEVIERYGLKVEQGFALLPGGIRRSLQEKKYMNPAGESVPLFNLEYLKGTGTIFICEGIFDALSIETAGHRGISINSAGNVGKLTECLTTESMIVSAFDNDQAGKEATEKLRTFCLEQGIPFDTLPIDKRFKDCNEWLVSDRQGFFSSLSVQGMSSAESEFDSLFNREPQSFITTGMKSLDKALGGGLVADLYCVGGVPAAGKSALVLQVAQGISEAGKSVLYCSTELSKNEVTARNISRISYQQNNIDYLSALEINTGKISEDKRKIFSSCRQNYINSMNNFKISTLPNGRTIESIKNEVKKHKAISGVTPVIIIDYLQNLQGSKEGQTEKQVIDSAMTELKGISNTYNTPVIIVSSLNREGYNSSGMTSFKESGAVEYSSAVALIVRPTKQGKEQLEARKTGTVNHPFIETEVDIVKNRHYTAGKIILSFFGKGNYFKEAS